MPVFVVEQFVSWPSIFYFNEQHFRFLIDLNDIIHKSPNNTAATLDYKNRHSWRLFILQMCIIERIEGTLMQLCVSSPLALMGEGI